MRQFDYSVLTQPITLKSTWSEFRESKDFVIASVFSGVFFGGMLLIALVNRQYGVVLVIFLFALLTNGVIIFQFKRIVLFRRFVQANRLEYVDGSYSVNLPGIIFNIGNTQRFVGGIADPSQDWFLANYEYTTGSGKNETTHSFGVMRLKLPRKLPHVLLDSKKNNFLMLRNLPGNFSSDQRLQLEGDFNNYFTVYVPANYQRDVLYFLTPELMAGLIDKGSNYDFEVIDDNLFIYGDSLDFRKSVFQENIEKWMNLASYFGSEFEDNVERYADSRIENSKELNIVGAEGARLKKGVAWTSVIITVVLFAVYIFLWAVQLFL